MKVKPAAIDSNGNAYCSVCVSKSKRGGIAKFPKAGSGANQWNKRHNNHHLPQDER
jgi:hypothetical protein